MKMKLSRKRTCNGCRALTNDDKCELGFALGVAQKVSGIAIAIEMKPEEECLKPTSVDEFMTAISDQRQSWQE